MTAPAGTLGVYEDDALRIICDAHGWDFAVVAEHQQRLRADMQREASAMAEGFCPRCSGRLAPDPEFAGRCGSCDLFWHSRYEHGALMGTGAASGWWVRERRAGNDGPSYA